MNKFPKIKLINDLHEYSKDVNVFIQSIIQLSKTTQTTLQSSIQIFLAEVNL